MNTKNVFMLAVLSAVMLTGLAATTIQATPAFASKDECEKNDDHNCNNRSIDIVQKNDCKVEDGGANGGDGGDTGDGSTSGSNGGQGSGNSNDFSCDNTLDSTVNTGDDAFTSLP